MTKLLVLHDWKVDSLDSSNSPDSPDSLDIEKYVKNKPVTRQKLILDKLTEQKLDATILIPEFDLTREKLVKLDVHSPEYLHFLENCFSSYQSNPDLEYLRDGGLVPLNFSRRKSYQSYKDILLWRQIGYWCDDVLTPIYKNTYAKAMKAANICYKAPEFLEKYNYIYCVTGSPGHHAMKDGYGGYCYLNNAMICAKRLRKDFKFKKIALLDIDFHHGNGTQDICWEDPAFLSVSIHADPRFDYPSFSGFSHETNALSNNINIIFDKDSKGAQYLKKIQEAMTAIDKFNPDILIIPFGADTLSTDPEASKLYKCGLMPEDYKIIGAMITVLYRGKIIITQEGGYDLDNVPTAAYNFIFGLTKGKSIIG